MKEVKNEFIEIPDPSLSKAKEYLYACTIDLSWQRKTLHRLTMEENTEISMVVEEKIDNINDKFVIYVDSVHHYCFVTKLYPHYKVLKKRATTKIHSSGDDSSSVKKEVVGASYIHLNSMAP